MDSRDIRRESKLNLFVSICLECVTFVFLLYLVSCFAISFQRHIFSVIIHTINMNIIVIFWNIFKKEFGKRTVLCIMLVSFFTLIFLIYRIGYLEVAAVLTKF